MVAVIFVETSHTHALNLKPFLVVTSRVHTLCWIYANCFHNHLYLSLSRFILWSVKCWAVLGDIDSM